MMWNVDPAMLRVEVLKSCLLEIDELQYYLALGA
jgi:hypothetical protein